MDIKHSKWSRYETSVMTFSIGDSRDVSVLATLALGLKAKESVDPERNRSLGNGSSLQDLSMYQCIYVSMLYIMSKRY